MLTRLFLFLITNLAVLIVLTVVMGLLTATGVIPTGAAGQHVGLLVFASLFGFGGAFISLAMSKWVAKRATGAQVIVTPRNGEEAWLIERVAALAQQAGIGVPEVAVYPRATRTPSRPAPGGTRPWSRSARGS